MGLLSSIEPRARARRLAALSTVGHDTIYAQVVWWGVDRSHLEALGTTEPDAASCADVKENVRHHVK